MAENAPKLMISRAFLLLFLLLTTFGVATAQQHIKWTLEIPAETKSVTKDDNVTVKLKATIEPKWHLYSIDQPAGGPFATTIKVSPETPFEISGKIRTSEPIVAPDNNFIVDGKPLETRYFADNAEFEINVLATGDAARDKISFDVKYQLCDDSVCLPPKAYRITESGTEEIKRTSSASQNASSEPPGTSIQTTETQSGDGENSDLWGFIWLAAGLGALSLLTPCVFPMIPITVSYFTNHSGGSRKRSVKLATIYSLGIIATFTLLGMALAIFVGAAGINIFAANPWVNIFIAGIFLFFAFNLFGAYEIAVPTGVLTKLDSITRSKEGEGGGIVGALLMGLTFTLTSFTCTSPFVGTILVSASQGDWQRPMIGMLAFSTVFALPFFVLALVPQFVSQLPRAGGWMNSIKVTMGFLEVAAAMKFISNVDLVWKWGIFTRDVVLAIWIAIAIILSFYLLGKFQLSHDSKPDRIGAIRLLGAILSLAIAFYLVTGLFGAKLGELESFLPPDLSPVSAKVIGGNAAVEPVWISNDYEKALALAKSENKLVFIDFTGYTCTNCRWMEANVFVKPEVSDQFKDMILLKLYTDGDGEVYERQQAMQERDYGTVALPFYAIIDGDGKKRSTFAGMTRDTQEFIDFLVKGKM